MADEARISQVVSETVAADDVLDGVRASQVVREVPAAISAPEAARVSQIVLEMVSASNALHVSQVVLETVAASTTTTLEEPIRPLEAVVIHMGTGRHTMIADVFPRWYETGLNPETGQPTLFYVDPRGIIYVPDWTIHEGSPTGHYYNMLGSSSLETDITSISGATLASMVITAPTPVFAIAADGFKYSYPAMVYIARPQTLAAPDTTNRYEIVAIGQIVSNTTTTITVDFTAQGSQVFLGATAATLAAATSSWRMFVGPAVLSVWFPPLRDDQSPTLDDRQIAETMSIQTGWSTDFALPLSGIDHADDGPVFPHILVLEQRGYWPFDVPLGSGGAGDGFPTSFPTAASTDMPRSLPLDPNIDNTWTTLRAAGHVVWANLLQLSPTQNWDVELLGVVVKGIIEKGSSGVNPA